mmetsp:Transcript_20836/g.36948  ORF Transcript_20836/g.36948 Transcript_20836/m.36948 type:complete len:795 (-) Transcript_20836:35-2419(-)
MGDSAGSDRERVAPTCGLDAAAARAAEQFYLTTAINYTNGAPHVGHAYEGATSDVISRYHRVAGRDVFFLTGSDEHGQKVEQSATKAGITPQEIGDKYSKGFQDLNKSLNLSNDYYIRTTAAHHYEFCKKLWEIVRGKGDIYLKDYEGWYNVHEERYVTDKEAEECDFKDEYGRPFERKSEESYFFRMSKYQDRLVHYITEENPGFIQPESRKKEILSFLSEPLQDLCVSRTALKWGIPCPPDPEYTGDKSHVMYVWFDALSNYMSGINMLRDEDPQNWQRFWPADVHVIGKDIARFHTVIWPTMLMSAEMPLPQTVFCHGFVNAGDGQKMSKSIGNVIDPVKMLEIYPADSLRFYLARASPFGGDLAFSEESLCALHNATLADGIGNLLHRATSLCKSVNGGKIPEEASHRLGEEKKFPFDVAGLKAIYEICFAKRPGEIEVSEAAAASGYNFNFESAKKGDGFQIQGAAQALAEAISNANTYLQTAEPWKVKGKDEESQALKRSMVRAALEAAYAIGHFLYPFCPDAMDSLFDRLGVKQTNLSALSDNFDNLPSGTQTFVGEVLFSPLEAGVGKVVKSAAKGDKAAAKEKYEAARAAKLAKREAAVKDSRKGVAAAKSAEDPDRPQVTMIDFRVGRIVEVWELEGSDQLFCEKIDVGEEEPREIASGLRKHYQLDEMKDRLVVVCCNLKARKLAGFNSHGMVICATAADKSKVEILTPPEGSKVGERLFLEGRSADEYEPSAPNYVARKKVFEAVAKKLVTTDNCEASWDGKLLVTSAGKCTVPTLSGAQLS